ncbi:MAG: hypothetical protein WC886_06575, partial [Saccharofermentanaceae bacterium]
MKTINTILPIYDSLEKQDKNRTGTQMPVLTPRFRLPAFQWKDDTDGAATVSTVELIGINGESASIPIGLNGWAGVGGTTIIANGLEVVSAYKASGTSYIKTIPIVSVKLGDVILIKLTLTNRTAIVKYASVYEDGSQTATYTLTEGRNIISHTITKLTPSGYCELVVQIESLLFGISDYSLSDVSIGYPNLNSSLQALPASHALTSDVYFQYKGTTLNYPLPLGSYYLKITMNSGHVYYSDWFVVTNIYENLVTSFTNIDYDVFTAQGSTIIEVIETGASGNAKSNGFIVKKGDALSLKIFIALASGTAPSAVLKNGSGTNISNVASLSAGLNEITLTATSADTAYLFFINAETTDYYTSEMLLIRSYSPDFAKIVFNDTHDLGDILYHDGFIETCFLEAKLNIPTHEVVEVGEEKNGIFVAEKIVTKYKYKIIANIGRQLYTALMRLPQHDTISITDEVGNVYTPKVGNIWVSQPNWIFYDICRI